MAERVTAAEAGAGAGAHRDRESKKAWRGVKRPVDQRAADAQRWVEARLAGTSIGEIARNEGVSPSTVSRGTSSAVPARREPTPSEVHGWVLRRRQGVSVTDLALESEWSPGTIGRLTHGSGPYPRTGTGGAGRGRVDPGTVRRWVQDRQLGISLVAIARDGETTAEKVGRATKPFGPFPSPQRAPAGYLTFRQLSVRLGISRPALQRRLEQDELPEPAGHSDSGWPYWRAGDVEHWIATLDMARCRICGAYLKRLDWHMISRHGQPRSQRLPRREG